MNSLFTRTGARESLWLTLGFWFLYFIVLVTPSWGDNGRVPAYAVATFAAFAVSGLITSTPIYLAACWTLDWSAMRRTLLMVVAVLLVTALNTVITAQLSRAGMAAFTPQVPQAPYLIDLLVNGQTLVIVHTLYAVAVLLALQGHAARARAQQLAEARAAAHQATLAALRFQLNPHFLFNTLNAISSLVGAGRAADAESMLQKLSDFLRSTLSSNAESMVTLDEELAAIETYLEIEGVRFADRMVLRIDCPPELRDAKAPSLILQPLVENAVKYAVAPALRPVTVSVEASAEAGVLKLCVRDDGAPCRTSGGTGIGLANVRARLAVLYGEAACLEAGRDGDGFTACVTLPLDVAARAGARAA